jgi:hypothetical protein
VLFSLFNLSIALAVSAIDVPVSDVWVYAPTVEAKARLETVGMGWAEGSEGGWLRMHGGPAELARLELSDLPWRYAAKDLVPETAYQSPEEMVAALEALALSSPERVTLVDLGWSVNGRPVVGVRISFADTPSGHWRILGAHHGDETSSAELALFTAQSLATTEDPALLDLLERDAVWIVPHINPDGIENLRRTNDNGVDLNRNYDFEWSSTEWAAGAHWFSEPETRNVRTLGATVQFGAGLSMHSGATNLGWVWNYTTDPTQDAEIVAALAGAYGESCTQPGFYLTNGAEWYITHGDTTDWSYGRHGVLDYTLEVTNRKNPNASTMSEALDNHLPGVHAFLMWPWLMRGLVQDAETGRGIPATIQRNDAPWPFTTGLQGRFSRPVASGTFGVTVSAPGYAAVDVELSTDSGAIPTIELTPTHISSARPNPRLLSRSGDGFFTLDVEADSVTLIRPGEAPSIAERQDDGWHVGLEAISPGLWSLDIDGMVAPRVLFVGELDTAVSLESVDTDSDGTLELHGEGFGRGCQIWGIWGTDRGMTPVTVLSVSESIIVLDPVGIPLESETVDLLLVTNGRQVVLLNIGGDVVLDTGVTPADTGVTPDTEDTDTDSGSTSPQNGDPTRPPDDAIEGDVERGPSIAKPVGCGCGTGALYPSAWALVILLLVPSTRRHHC